MDFYKIIAKSYGRLYEEEQKIKLEILKSNLKIGKRDLLLDVGCGTGLSSDFKCKVIGLDPSIEQLQQNKNPKKVLARAEKMPFKDKSFDMVISLTAIHNFEDIRDGIKEIKRVGKKDFAFGILKKSSKFRIIEDEIKKNFKIKKMLDGGKDFIFFLRG